MNNSWGYNITDTYYKTTKQCIQYLVNAAGHNGNFLLNIGPMADGTVQPEFTDTLKAIGGWMAMNGETIYGTRGNYISPQPWGVVTAKAKSVFVHLLNHDGQSFIFLPKVKDKIVSANLFENNKLLKFKQQPEGVFIYLDQTQIDPIDTIIELQMQ